MGIIPRAHENTVDPSKKSPLQPTRTPTIRHSTDVMPLKPLQSMIRMVSMATSDAEAQKPRHPILPLTATHRQLLLRRTLARIRRAQPKSANRAPRHVAAAFQTNRAGIRSGALDFRLLVGRAMSLNGVVVSGKRALAVRAFERDLRGNLVDRGGAFARARQSVVLDDEFGAFVEGAPGLHLLEVRFPPHFPAHVVDVERVGESGCENGGLEVVGSRDVRLE